jgi:hypothetical protein
MALTGTVLEDGIAGEDDVRKRGLDEGTAGTVVSAAWGADVPSQADANKALASARASGTHFHIGRLQAPTKG